jgi:hypothetical protein
MVTCQRSKEVKLEANTAKLEINTVLNFSVDNNLKVKKSRILIKKMTLFERINPILMIIMLF